MESIHGHEVMHMMMESGKAYTAESLLQDITDRFGNDSRFHTCSAEDLTAAELIDFLKARGKFVEEEEGFKTDPEKMCNHE